MKKRILFIINPISGVGQKNILPQLIENHLDYSKYSYEISYSNYKKHAKELAYEASKIGIDIVCAIGGDGSVHEVGTALIGTQTKLAIIPCGSGNGLARHLKIPLTFEEAIQTINEERFINMDTGIVNDKPFLGVGGYGFDALIAKKFDEKSVRGFWTYAKLVMKEYFHYKPSLINIEIDGQKIEKELILCTIANASEFGNGFCVSPNSNVSDGTFELCLMKPFPKTFTPFIIRQFFKRTIDQSPYFEIIPIKKARITSVDNLAHYDGEPFEVRQELNIEVKPKSLTVIVGEKY
jgi:diacylglycerol kinase (ATP)